MAPSSTYRERLACRHCLAVSRRDAVYNTERIGDKGDPYGVPFKTGNGSET